MARVHLTTAFFLLLLAGHEGARISETAKLVEALQQQQQGLSGRMSDNATSTPDLDWPGCGKKSMFCSAEGCHRQYLWLDTPRQSCRFTDDYKLAHNQNEFLKVELARLEEKSAKVARTGCLFGSMFRFSYDTYMWKCMRRTQQMIRLTRFVGKALQAAKDDPMHPAREYATSTSVQEAMERVGNNIAAGFEKYEGSEGTGLAFAQAWKSMLGVRETAQKRRVACNNCTLTLDEESEEQADLSAAMLGMVGGNLTLEQRATLKERFRSEEDAGDAEAAEGMLAAMEADVRRTNLAGGIGGAAERMPLTADQREAFEEELQNESPSNASALVQASARGGLAAGSGPIQWIFTHGLGWVVSRIAWLVLFVIGAALNIVVRGMGLVISLLGCVMARTLQWLLGDLVVNVGWKGEYYEAVAGFKRIGRCAPWAWDLVGFNRCYQGRCTKLAACSTRNPCELSRTMMQRHAARQGKSVRKEGENLLAAHRHGAMDCGLGSERGKGSLAVNAGYRSAAFSEGRCFCGDGHYPAGDGPGCGPLETVSGCVCAQSWTESSMLVFTKTRHGCSDDGHCEVDMNHSSYGACKESLQKGSWSGTLVRYDRCYFRLARSEIGPAARLHKNGTVKQLLHGSA